MTMITAMAMITVITVITIVSVGNYTVSPLCRCSGAGASGVTTVSVCVVWMTSRLILNAESKHEKVLQSFVVVPLILLVS
jgi:hypothetical protein